jgi:hypothetical protein
MLNQILDGPRSGIDDRPSRVNAQNASSEALRLETRIGDLSLAESRIVGRRAVIREITR